MKLSVEARLALGEVDGPEPESRFSPVHTLVVGGVRDATRGLERLLQVDNQQLHRWLAEPVESIEREVEAAGTAVDRECLQYVLHERAGSSPKVFANGVRDEGRHGESLDDFVSSAESQEAGLSRGEVRDEGR